MSLDNSKKTGPIDGGHQLQLTIENKTFNWNEQYITGQQAKVLADLPLDSELYLSVPHPWKDELIENSTKVDLARPEIEHFYIKKALELTVDGKRYEWHKQYITGRQIKELAAIEVDSLLFLSIKGPWEDEQIDNDSKVDLARPGIEHFYSKELPVQFVIIVNGREKSWNKRTITFQEVVVLAFGNYNGSGQTCYTVNYKGGPAKNPKGSMVFGDTVFVQNKMIFNVSATDKS